MVEDPLIDFEEVVVGIRSLGSIPRPVGSSRDGSSSLWSPSKLRARWGQFRSNQLRSSGSLTRRASTNEKRKFLPVSQPTTFSNVKKALIRHLMTLKNEDPEYLLGEKRDTAQKHLTAMNNVDSNAQAAGAFTGSELVVVGDVQQTWSQETIINDSLPKLDLKNDSSNILSGTTFCDKLMALLQLLVGDRKSVV